MKQQIEPIDLAHRPVVQEHGFRETGKDDRVRGAGILQGVIMAGTDLRHVGREELRECWVPVGIIVVHKAHDTVFHSQDNQGIMGPRAR